MGVREEGLVYRVGVHHWNDHGYGPADARVRVFVGGSLVVETAPTTLASLDFWEECSVTQVEGEVQVLGVTGAGGEPHVVGGVDATGVAP